MSIHDTAGVIGSVVVIVAYFATQAGWFGVNDPRFTWANLLGAVLIIFSLLMDFNLAAFIVEIFWLLISVFGLARYYISRR